MRCSRGWILAAVVCLACRASHDPAAPLDGARARTFRLGFSPFPPRPDAASLVASLAAWTGRADAAILHQSVPFRALLSGTPADAYVTANELPQASYFRSRNLPVVVTVDPTNGLDRSAESPELVASGRSIREPAVQQAYRDYVKALATLVRPTYLGLAAETNLIRAAAPAPIYAALVQMTNAAAADLRALPGTPPTLYVSVQAEVAWGFGADGARGYVGVEADWRDFPFVQALGISSYPYFAFADPDAMPLDYYSRLTNGRAIPVLVAEGGWTSASVATVRSSPETQARYLRRQERMLDSAHAVAAFSLFFSDIDVASFPTVPAASTVPLFAHLGLVDTALRPKPALATYDSIRARPLAK